MSAAPPPLRIAALDDHPAVRAGLTARGSLADGPSRAYSLVKDLARAYTTDGIARADAVLLDAAVGLFDTEDARGGIRTFRRRPDRAVAVATETMPVASGASPVVSPWVLTARDTSGPATPSSASNSADGVGPTHPRRWAGWPGRPVPRPATSDEHKARGRLGTPSVHSNRLMPSPPPRSDSNDRSNPFRSERGLPRTDRLKETF